MQAGSSARLTRMCIAAACIARALAPAAASAQPERPVSGYVVDLRGSVAPYGQNEDLSAARGLDPLDTPAVGLGFEAGVHAYLYRWRVITFGLGASYHASRGSRGPEELNSRRPPLQTTFSAISPQLSFNFGARDGWSYLSGGIGRSRLSLRSADDDEARQRTANTLNYGGGARWFLNDRTAFSLDLRFYAISPLPMLGNESSSPRMTLTVLNIGASFR